MNHPFERVPVARRRSVMLALLISTFLVLGALAVIDRSLRSPVTPNGVVSFELCAVDSSCGAAVATYRAVRLEIGTSLGLDYLFMPLYSSGLAAALVFLAAPRSARVRSIAAWLAWGAMIAALLDAVENAALYHMVSTDTATPTASWAASGPALVKFGLIVAALVAIPIIALQPRAKLAA